MTTIEKSSGTITTITDRNREVAAASLVGTTIEWYDFLIYATMAGVIFNQYFCTLISPLAAAWPKASALSSCSNVALRQ
jgi:hypothetical protein